ncbi:MAG: sigma-70 family RNA polymerase sigma factor [Myxococcales bacterium]|nr:MAG: sigma-70 family RNA polymerase sigma factor [Myxococcales bacterium]
MPLPSEDPLDQLDAVVGAERLRLARLARHQGLSAEDALDCVHDAFCAFLQRARRADLPADAAGRRAFLATMVTNAARNRRRRHHVARPHLPLDPEREDDAPSVESLVARAEEHIRLRGCVEQLCDTQRSVVTLRLLEEHDGQDTAASLGISRNHADVLLHRARARLLACMIDDDGTPG